MAFKAVDINLRFRVRLMALKAREVIAMLLMAFFTVEDRVIAWIIL
jgi:hypothetical protein